MLNPYVKETQAQKIFALNKNKSKYFFEHYHFLIPGLYVTGIDGGDFIDEETLFRKMKEGRYDDFVITNNNKVIYNPETVNGKLAYKYKYA